MDEDHIAPIFKGRHIFLTGGTFFSFQGPCEV